VIFAQFASTAERYGRNASKVRVVGCPVRTGLGEADAGEARRHFGLRDDRRTLLVVAGSLGAANINRAVGAIRSDLDGLSDAWQVLHVTGPGKLDAVQEAWRDASIAHVATEFCEHMELAYAAGDLALCRSGAATVAELAAAGLPAVFMPYPYHRDQQQRHNAAERVGSGAAVMASDAGDPAANAAALRETMLPILRQPARLEAMRRAAAGAGSGRAAEEIARWLAGQGAGPP